MALEFYDENIPCLAACPVHTNAGMYVAAIADGEDELAYLTARLPNPFASVCGRVCAAPCEDACRRGKIDRPIAIRALKRFVTEQYGPETGDNSVAQRVAEPPSVELPQSIGHRRRRARRHGLRPRSTPPRLPGHRLRRPPTSSAVPCGSVSPSTDSTVTCSTPTWTPSSPWASTSSTRPVSASMSPSTSSDSATTRSSSASGPPSAAASTSRVRKPTGVFKAIEFLINMNRGFEVEIGSRVLVIGGGDVAMDAARTALRAADYEAARDGLSAPAGERPAVNDALDAARTAKRAGAEHITIMSLESRDEMPAHDFEIEEAEHEGIEFVHRRGPRAITTAAGRVTGLDTVGVRSVFDADGRFSPDFDEDDVRRLDADTIILAIGQAIDLDSLGTNGPDVSQRKTIQIDWDTGATSMADVWSGGDAAKGPRTLIDAIADGRRSAADIHRSFGGELPEDPARQDGGAPTVPPAR